MISKTYPLGSFERYPYVVILSRMEGKFLLSRHKPVSYTHLTLPTN